MQEAEIILGGDKSRKFRLSCGVRQGCPISPLLFNTVIEILALQRTDVFGIQVGDITHKLSLFTDDAVFITGYERNPISIWDSIRL